MQIEYPKLPLPKILTTYMKVSHCHYHFIIFNIYDRSKVLKIRLYSILVAPVERTTRKEEHITIVNTSTNEAPTSSIEPEIMDECSSDDSNVKPLKILAQICVDELNRCNEIEQLSRSISSAKTEDTVYISSESDSDASSTRSSQRGVISGGIRRSSGSDSDSSSGNDSSSDSSSSDSEDSESVEVVNEENVLLETNKQVENVPEESIVISEDNSSIEKVEMEKNDVFNPETLKDICKNVLHENSMFIRYDVPSLKYLCEHTLASSGMEIPLICFVNEEDTYEYITEPPSSQDEGVYLCLDGEFDETELANLFSGAGNGAYESVEIAATETAENTIDKTSLIDQCVALQNILSSPPPEEIPLSDMIDEPANEHTAYFMDTNTYTVGDEFHDTIQYEETVIPSENADDFMVAIESFKKYLQKKYVQPSCYHKMFVINKLLRKYRVHQVATSSRKSIVHKRFRKILSKLRQTAKQQHKPKQMATRRSARIAGKIKQQEMDFGMPEKRTKSAKSQKISRTDSIDCRQLLKTMDVSDLVTNSGSEKTDNDKVYSDILKLIAKKRTLKRKLSICHRPTLQFDDDGYSYDEDGQISKMVSSFINDGFDETSLTKKSRPRKSFEKKGNKEQVKTIKNSQQQPVKMDANKKKVSKKISTQDKTSKKETAKTIPKLDNKPTVASANKTEGNPFHTKPLTFPTKASMKEIIPAKRTRFLSIDGRSMNYGTGAKKLHDHMEHQYKEHSQYPGVGKRKNPCKKNADVAKEVVSSTSETKPKRIKERRKTEVDRPKPKSPGELKSLPQSVQEAVNAFTKAQNSSGKSNAQTKTFPNKEHTKAKTENQTKIKERPTLTTTATVPHSTTPNITETTKKPRRTRFSDNIVTSTEDHIVCSNVDSQMSTRKSVTNTSNSYTEKTDRNLRSTMVSPLRIIIEPNRNNSPEKSPKKENPFARDPLAIESTTNDHRSPESVKIPTASPNTGKKLTPRHTRFSDKFENFIENPMTKKCPPKPPMGIVSRRDVVTKSNFEPIHKNDDQNLTRTSKPMHISPQPQPMAMEKNASIKSNFDIETYLPSTKILQPKPARRCISRAQTIAFTESPYQSVSPEPMKSQRTSQDCMSLRKKVSLNEPPIYQISSMFKSRDAPYTIPKRIISSARMNSTSKPMNVQPKSSSPIQKPKIDMSNYPDPDSLQIPSIDLRSPLSSGSPLLLPQPISLSASKPIQMPTALLKPPTESKDIPTSKFDEGQHT